MKLTIKQDQDPGSPREWDNLGRMLCWHKRYKLGDEQPKTDPEEVLAELPEGSIVLPLFLYDHGGLSMSTGDLGDRFDSGQVGFIVATPSVIRKEWNLAEGAEINEEILDKVRNILRCEVETYDAFLQGNVWGFVLEDETTCDKGHKHAEHIDSCWGFFGNDKDGIAAHLPDEAKSLLDDAWNNRGA